MKVSELIEKLKAMTSLKEQRRKAVSGLRITRWEHPSIRCHLLGLLQGIAEVLDGLVTLFSLGFFMSNFEMQIAFYRGISHHLIKKEKSQ